MIEPTLIGTIKTASSTKSYEEFLSNKLDKLMKSPNGQEILKEHSYYIWFDNSLEALKTYKIIKKFFEEYEIKLMFNSIFFKNIVDMTFIKLIM